MKEILERAAEELLNAAARLQELAQQPMGGALNLQNLSAEDEEKLGQLFNAWTQKNIISDLESIKDRLSDINDFIDELPPSSSISEVIDHVGTRDFDALDRLDDVDLDDIRENSESISQLREQFEELATQLGPLTTLAELLNLDLLIATLQAGIEAKKAQEMSHGSAAGNGNGY